MHWVGDTEMCCECYVKAGNPPADWHLVCMATYDNFKKTGVAFYDWSRLQSDADWWVRV
jgi:hypothetical protein